MKNQISSQEELVTLLAYCHISLLQIKLDLEEHWRNNNNEQNDVLTESQLKIIVIDKILRLYDPNYLGICDNSNFLLTSDEQGFIDSGNTQDLIFIKNSMIEASILFRTEQKNITILSDSNGNISLYKDLLKEFI